MFIAGEVPLASVVAYEPDDTNLPLLHRNLEAALDSRHRIVEACAGASNGHVAFQSGDFGRSRVVGVGGGGDATTTVPKVDVFPDLANADLVKIDIEGGEWEILADPRFADIPARAVVMEYHPWQCPEGDPRAHAERLLTGQGFTVRTARQHVPGLGELWAWREGGRSDA